MTDNASANILKQFVLTCSMSKRLIGKGMAAHPAVRRVLQAGKLVIVAGTTNGYVAEDILSATGQAEGFQRQGFRRGMVAPPGVQPPMCEFSGDVILVDGRWQKGKQIFDVADDLQAGDVVLKGGNALDAVCGRAAVLIGDPAGGTVLPSVRAVIGKRAKLIVPIGLEKRVMAELTDLADLLNAPGADGPRLMPLPGETFTELDAIELLTGASAKLVAAGGVYGAEGSVWIAISGEQGQVALAEDIIKSVASEPPCEA